MLEISRPGIATDYLMDFPAADRFLKLPIENYLDLLGVSPLDPQIALTNAINDPSIRFVTAALSRRTGKTFISNVIANLLCLVPGTNVLIMSPNYSLSQISWDLQRQLLNKFDVELTRSNAKDRIIELSNGSMIRMGSVSQADSVVGRSYDLILFDEAALDDRGEDVFNIQLRPTLDKMNSKAIFISTPRGKNWFHKFYLRGFDPDFPSWCSIKSDYRENPRVPLEDIEQARKVMSTAEFNQEYLADFVAMQGQIWHFNSDNCLDIDISAIERMDCIAGLDMGFRDPTAFCVMLTDGFRFYVVDEYFSAEKSTSKHAEHIGDMLEKWDIDFIYIDSAAAQTKFDLASDYDISTINAKKSMLDGIGYVASVVEHDRVLVDRSCKTVLDCFSNYVWDPRVGLIAEKPRHDIHSHMGDALRYAMYSHSYNMEEEDPDEDSEIDEGVVSEQNN